MKRTIKLTAIAATLLTAALALSSCSLSDLFGKAGITTPVTGSVTTQKPTEVTTGAPMEELPPVDLSEIDLSEYISLDYENAELVSHYKKREITDELVESEMTTALIYYSYYTLEQSDKSEKGQYVEIEFTGYMDGVAFDGGHSDKATILLDDEKSGYIPGFAAGIIGVPTGKEIDVNIVFPEGYSASLSGKPAVFKITVHGICKPTVTDEIADKMSGGKVKKADEFRAYFRDYLETMEEYEQFESVYQSLFSTLEEKAVFKKLVNEQVDYYYNSMYNYYNTMAAYYNMNLKELLASEGLDEISLKERAEEYTKSDMILYCLAQKENIVMSDEIYNECLNSTLEYWN
ncbi:MAG: FKBP-type peptidyl-prolyl cis-trans isomerase, partial [Clostridia bacterium]|nr:FKBP-type peptidyl-prolyl cis-trans isomerase [Clostridia bacterium]